jgi:TolB-like protein/tetratricopeptide (TPR) repeat protein
VTAPVPSAVFLSYASQDAEAARRICEALRAAGIEVWFDQSELRGGDTWDRKIRQQLHDCRLFMPIVSAHTEARTEGYFRREWKLAVDRTHDMSDRVAFLVPVVIDATPDSKADVPEAFRAVQWTRLRSGEPNAAFVTRIAALLANEGSVSAGIKSERPPSAIHTAAAKKSMPLWMWIAGAALVLSAAGSYMAWRGNHWIRESGVPETTASKAITADAISEKSLAVLPFVDMSEKHDQEYFADGIAEEILDQLARIGDLRVIARTSSFSFKGKSDDIPTIGRKLRVATILEGSVRRSGSRLKVTTQLVRAATGEHVWSNSYERESKDVFGIQTDIATSVAGALKATLLEHFNASTAGTTNAEAFDVFLKAQALGRRERSEAGVRQAIALCRQAVSIDPSYGDAWALLASYTDGLMVYSAEKGKLSANAQEFARRAIEARPDRSIGYVSYARALVFDLNVAAARGQIEKALQLNPNDPWGIAWAALFARMDGKFEESVRLMRKSLDFDPENVARNYDFAVTLWAAGRNADAETAFRHYSEGVRDPNFVRRWASMRLAAGDARGALQLLDREMGSKGRRSCSCLGLALERLGRQNEAAAAFKDLENNFKDSSAVSIAEIYAQHGDADRAFRWLDAAISSRDPYVIDSKWNPMLAPIRTDARFAKLLERLGLPP